MVGGVDVTDALPPGTGRLVVEAAADGDPAPLDPLIGIDEEEAGRSGDARSRVLIADREPALALGIELIAEISAGDPVLVVVVAISPVRAQVGKAERVVERAAQTREPSRLAIETEAAPFGGQLEARVRSCAAMGEDLEEPRHGVGTVERALGAADQLDSRQVVGRQVSEVEGPARVVRRDAIDQHLGVVGLSAPHEERGHSATACRLHDRGSRRRAKDIQKAHPLCALQIPRGGDEAAGRRFAEAGFTARRRDDQCVLECRHRHDDAALHDSAGLDLRGLRSAGLGQPILLRRDGVAARWHIEKGEFAPRVGRCFTDRDAIGLEQDDTGSGHDRSL